MSLSRLIVNLVTRVAELERRQASMIQQGPVHEVDPKAGTVRLRLGGTDDEPFLSGPIPYAQIAGARKVHSSPSIGQQMTALFNGGSFEQGLAVPMTWSDKNPSPSNDGSIDMDLRGTTRTTQTDKMFMVEAETIILKSGGSTFELTGSGLKMVAADYQFD